MSPQAHPPPTLLQGEEEEDILIISSLKCVDICVYRGLTMILWRRFEYKVLKVPAVQLAGQSFIIYI